MLKKIALISVSVLGLVGMASLGYCAEAVEKEEAPSIEELEEYAATAEEEPVNVEARVEEAAALLEAGKPLAAQTVLQELDPEQLTDQQAARVAELSEKISQAVAAKEGEIAATVKEEMPDQQQKALSLQQQLQLKWKVQKQARETRAGELVDQGRYLLYYENKPKRAYDLARKALLLDPASKAAIDLKTLAGLQAGIPAEERRFEADKMYQLPRAREQSAHQALVNALAKARQLYQKGNYQEALEQLRSARLITESLAPYMDVSSQRHEVQRMLEMVQQDYEEHQRELAGQRKAEAAERAEKWAERIAEEERKKRGRWIDEINELIEQREFDAARGMLEDLEVTDPSDELVPRLRQRVAQARHDYLIDKANAARERGDLQRDVWESNREIVPEHLFNYPDKKFWQEVVEERDGALYPSIRAKREMPEEDQAVYDALDEVYEFTFEDTPLPLVKEYFEQVTPVPYLLYRGDLPPDQAPVTFVMKTTLRNALNHITDLTDMAWKVEGGMIKIGGPESLRELEARVYPIRDLLLSFEDAGQAGEVSGAGVGGGLGGGGGGGGFGPQFAGEPEDAQQEAAQFDGEMGGAGGAGAAGGGGGQILAQRTQFLVNVLNSVCSDEPWVNFSMGLGMQPGEGAGAGATGGGFGEAGGGFGGAGGGFGGAGGGPAGFGMGAAGAGAGQEGLGAMELERQPGWGHLTYAPGTIVIYETTDVHSCIENLLKDLRTTMKIQVHVDLRILSVSTNFMREVGFRWDDFILDTEAFESPYDQLKGFGMSSPNWGGFGPTVTPPVFDTIFVPEPDDPTEGEFEAVISTERLWLTHPWAPEWEIDEDTGVIEWEKTILPTTAPFMGTGTPFFDQSSGLNLDLGWGGDTMNLSGFFRLAHQRDAVRTLSAPQIMLANGQQGYILNSTARDYVSTFSVDENVLVPEIDTVTSATGLTVRPVASSDLRYVFLELQPSISDVDLSNSVSFETFVGQPGGGDGGAAGATVFNFFTLPVVTQDQLATTLGVPDRGVIIVGGLSQASRERHEGGIPVLDKIPFIKALFSAKGRSLDRSTRFIMARPQIVILAEEEQRME